MSLFAKRNRGRPTADEQVVLDMKKDELLSHLLRIESGLDIPNPGSRGWCYLLEDARVITKDEFDKVQSLINDMRRDGRLPVDFCGDDEARAALNIENLHDCWNPDEYAAFRAQGLADCWRRYQPESLWKYQKFYIEMAVEKSDLKTLFGDMCAEYHVPIWNAGGWSDINSRVALLRRFQEHTEAGRHCVLLYCGDLDPGGELISGFIRENLRQVEKAAGWSPDEDMLTIYRFGLNADFVAENNLLWIEGLKTKHKYPLEDERHPDNDKAYVQDYLKKYGAGRLRRTHLWLAHRLADRLAGARSRHISIRMELPGTRRRSRRQGSWCARLSPLPSRSS